ncbi:MAG: ABC-F family ATP-binding cassette domain-containing protein [Lachnospiraceae bacterium]|nr:ABC-F family ATP-binding cassette domain-containing protein [Lachnospiraceae bacterium]
MLYQIHNGAVRFAAETILENINFEIRSTEKIAVVGRNGSGKTTLLKLIAGEVDLSKRDSDEDIYIATAGKPVIGYLKQIAFEDDNETMENEVRKAFKELLLIKARLDEMVVKMGETADEELIAKYTNLQERFEWLGGYTFEKEYEVVIKKFGFTEADKKKKLSEFSGGQRTKIAFVKMLLSKPDILLLDEPTNHLDMDTIKWLEEYLKNYSRAVVIISHDRMFLDRIVDVVYEIEYKTATRYPGNYSAFVERKRLNWEKQKKDYELQQKEIARLQEIVEKFKNKPTKVAMTRSKLKQIEHMVKIEAPARYDLRSFHANFTPERESVSDVLDVSGLMIGYDKVLSEITFLQKKRQKIGIIGDNGTGKSTFLRTITGQLDKLGGEYRIGAQTDIGYFEQQMAQYSSDKTVLDDFWDEFPTLTNNEVRSALGAFMFSGEEVEKKINMLSGGEKVRLALAKIFKTKPNFLILDEPTNHMDIVGKETLEAMLKEYTGTVLFVSHDRYFIKEVADSLLIFEGGKVRYYPYGYEQYVEEQELKAAKAEMADKSDMTVAGVKKTDIVKQQLTSAEVAETKPITAAVDSWQASKETARIKRRIEKLELLIAEQEELIDKLNEEHMSPDIQSDYVKLTELTEKIGVAEDLLMQYMEEWEELNDALK